MNTRWPVVTQKGIQHATSRGDAPADADKRTSCEAVLREKGIDEAFLATKLNALLQAQKRQWNPNKKSWEKVDDHDIQMRALREVLKIFGVYPSAEEKLDSRPPQKIDISGIAITRERA